MDPSNDNKSEISTDLPEASRTTDNAPLEFQDDTVQALLAKARQDSVKRTQMYSQTGGVLSNVPPGVREELETGIKFEPVIQQPTQNPEGGEEATANPQLKNLRTFQGDVAEALKSQNASVISLAMAERRRAQSRPSITQTPANKKRIKKNTWLALGSAVFLVIGLSILGGLYYVRLQNLPVAVVEAPKTLVSFDKQTEISFSGLTRDRFLSLIYDIKAKINVPMGEVSYISIVKRQGATPETTVKTEISGADFLNLLKTKTPPVVSKSLSKEFMLGRYQGKLPGIFMLLGLTSYDNVFVGMLNWEKDMWNDLGGLFSQNPTPVALPSPTLLATSTASTTANFSPSTTPVAVDTNKVSSTTAFLPPPAVKYSFADKVISNKDVRELQDQYGEAVLVYGFVTRDLLLIASNEETFKAILDKAFAVEAQ